MTKSHLATRDKPRCGPFVSEEKGPDVYNTLGPGSTDEGTRPRSLVTRLDDVENGVGSREGARE